MSCGEPMSWNACSCTLPYNNPNACDNCRSNQSIAFTQWYNHFYPFNQVNTPYEDKEKTNKFRRELMSGGIESMHEEKTRENNLVSHPKHYTFGKYEVIDVLADWFPNDPILWQVGKYIARAAHKGNELQDLEKAMVYLQRRINICKGTDKERNR